MIAAKYWNVICVKHTCKFDKDSEFSGWRCQGVAQVRRNQARDDAVTDGDDTFSWYCPSTFRSMADAIRLMNAAIAKPLDDEMHRQSHAELCDHWIGVAEKIADSLD
eukprot:5066358-Pyramimonas_sp.AAC.1